MEFRPTSPEEIERTLQFLLSQRAQIAANLGRRSGKVNTLAASVVSLAAFVDGLGEPPPPDDDGRRPA